ncbi:hypothetical protein [Candidatus Cytomitobacter primus]|uniref:Uncharacterized protein n=2 Tax=Candidatus Cytomitobacter primus TaxID=2066024 RepID=A0A5C0UEB8_9PROT|nr:hypothetical protein [Candidatus Cytomitobacter primus]QEK38435.1 hypothetical protein FZC34_00680 [Candidatus Cytomitobacter primus]
MKEEFMQNLKTIYKKAIKENLLSVALKAQEMMAKCNGYFCIKNKSIQNITELETDDLQNMLNDIKNKLENST